MRLIVVVPCYNEEQRLPVDKYAEWLALTGGSLSAAKLLFVDDGSRDNTLRLLNELVAGAPEGRAEVLALPTNQGKAEAVRRGLAHALGPCTNGEDIVGFWDSDLATPLPAIAHLGAVLSQRPHLQMVFAARVQLLGRKIARSPIRHYLGRVFATLASLTLDLPIYDTQCGAKLFRVTPQLRMVVMKPFLTRWVFDCEMIARFAAIESSSSSSSSNSKSSYLQEVIYEYPLEEWEDVAGSKVKPTDILKMAVGLLRIRLVYFLHSWPSGERKAKLVPTLVAAGTLLVGLAAFAVALLWLIVGRLILGTRSIK